MSANFGRLAPPMGVEGRTPQAIDLLQALRQLEQSWLRASATGTPTTEWEAAYNQAFAGVYQKCASDLKAVYESWQTT